MHHELNLLSYRQLVTSFLEKGYSFVLFPELTSTKQQIVMRHDIDFNCQYALRMAEVESRLGIRSTFFFQVASDSYNPFSAKNRESIQQIQRLGHAISLHFDPTIYEDFFAGFDREKLLFETFFDTRLDLVSLHRPSAFFQQYDERIGGVEHTYMKKYFEDVSYFSDSRGQWRYGHPLDSDTVQRGDSLQVLVHPIWWAVEGATPQDKLIQQYGTKREEIKEHYRKNCEPFNDISCEIV